MVTQAKPPENPLVLHRVYDLGAPHHSHEGDGADAAHAHAAARSTEHPLMRIEVRGVPRLIPNAKKGTDGKSGSPFVPNEGNRYERVVAVYQGGKQIPIT